MSGPYDTTHRDFMARVFGYATKRKNTSEVWKARLYALTYGAPFHRLAQIETVGEAVDVVEADRAATQAFISEFGSIVGKAYRETFRRLP